MFDPPAGPGNASGVVARGSMWRRDLSLVGLVRWWGGGGRLVRHVADELGDGQADGGQVSEADLLPNMGSRSRQVR